ncbi:MAG TPA: hypothetical protein VGM72_03730 [Micropepsaceae bacterium]|jgi:hypothetical protein
MGDFLVKTVSAFVLCGGLIAGMSSVRAADAADTITANYVLQCQKDQAACQAFTNDALRTLGQSRKICAPVPLSREQANQLVAWIVSRPQQASGHADDDIATAAGALWPCK